MLNINFLRKFILFSMFLMLVQILFGLKVREFIDLNIDIYGFDKKNLWLSNPNIEFYIHRSFSILILAVGKFSFLPKPKPLTTIPLKLNSLPKFKLAFLIST